MGREEANLPAIEQNRPDGQRHAVGCGRQAWIVDNGDRFSGADFRLEVGWFNSRDGMKPSLFGICWLFRCDAVPALDSCRFATTAYWRLTTSFSLTSPRLFSSFPFPSSLFPCRVFRRRPQR